MCVHIPVTFFQSPQKLNSSCYLTNNFNSNFVQTCLDYRICFHGRPIIPKHGWPGQPQSWLPWAACSPRYTLNIVHPCLKWCVHKQYKVTWNMNFTSAASMTPCRRQSGSGQVIDAAWLSSICTSIYCFIHCKDTKMYNNVQECNRMASP